VISELVIAPPRMEQLGVHAAPHMPTRGTPARRNCDAVDVDSASVIVARLCRRRIMFRKASQ
jgi:hypothetical protein